MFRIIDAIQVSSKMLSVNKVTFLVMLLASLVFVDHSDARRRSCSPRNCQVSSWSSWSPCSASWCGTQGSQGRSRTLTTTSACGGAPCPDLRERRQCYGTRPVNCQLSSWSEWSACTTPCGISGTQSSARHRITTEQCGGTCNSMFHKTRACPDLGCLNGGSLKGSICICKEGFAGECCETGGRGEGKYHKSKLNSSYKHTHAHLFAGICNSCSLISKKAKMNCGMY